MSHIKEWSKNVTTQVTQNNNHIHGPQSTRVKGQSGKAPSAVYPSFLFTLFQFQACAPLPLHFKLFFTSTLYSFLSVRLWLCLYSLFFNLLFLVLSILKSSDQSFSECSILHCSALSDKILSLLEEWGIEKKIFSITLDNASNNDNCQNFIKKKLNEGGLLLCDGILRKPITCYFAGLLVLFVLRSISFWICKLVIICILTVNY